MFLGVSSTSPVAAFSRNNSTPPGAKGEGVFNKTVTRMNQALERLNMPYVAQIHPYLHPCILCGLIPLSLKGMCAWSRTTRQVA